MRGRPMWHDAVRALLRQYVFDELLSPLRVSGLQDYRNERSIPEP